MGFINKVKELPDGVRGIIYNYLPRHDIANLIKEAITNNNLSLKYVRSRKFPNQGSKALPNGWVLGKSNNESLRSNNVVVWHLKELRPTSLISDTYVDGKIKRINISVGEKTRLRAIKRGQLSLIHDSRYNIKFIRNY